MAVLRRAKLIILTILSAAAFGSGCVSPSYSPRKITPGIYQGGLPRTPTDFATLRRQGIRTILSLETLTSHVEPERKLARQNGFVFRNIPMLPSFFKPPEHQVKEAILDLHDPSLQPVYIHCYIGTDRTTFITGLYRIYYLGWTPEAAWKEMIRTGFHASWWLYGFKVYFWEHTRPPAWCRLGEAPVEP